MPVGSGVDSPEPSRNLEPTQGKIIFNHQLPSTPKLPTSFELTYPLQNGFRKAARQARQGDPCPRPHRYVYPPALSTANFSHKFEFDLRRAIALQRSPMARIILEFGIATLEKASKANLCSIRLPWWCHPGPRRVHGRHFPFHHP
jgi:hypothetical protein